MDEWFEAAERPVGVKELTRRLNCIRAENIPPITFAMINRWLMEIGALELVQKNDTRTAKQPTRKGEELGLSTRIRRTKNGFFRMVVFDRNAQLVVAEHFEEWLFPKVMPEFVPQNRKTTVEDMVDAMKRTEQGIRRELTRRNIDITVD